MGVRASTSTRRRSGSFMTPGQPDRPGKGRLRLLWVKMGASSGKDVSEGTLGTRTEGRRAWGS